jgi:quinol monooxygenase YgiN
MSHLSVVARIQAQPEAREIVLQELRNLIEPTRNQDEGCITYELFQDNEEPAVFYFIENWESEHHLDRHLTSGPMKKFQKATEGLIETIAIYRMGRIS